MSRLELYNRAKALSAETQSTLQLKYPKGTIQQWETEIKRLESLKQVINVPHQDYEIKNAQPIYVDKHIKFVDFSKEGTVNKRVFFFNKVNLTSNQFSEIKEYINRAIDNAIKTGYTTDQGYVIVQFQGEKTDRKQHYDQKVNLNGFRIFQRDQIDESLREMKSDISNNNYTFNIDKIIVTIIKENGGGCNNTKHEKKIEIGTFKCSNPVSTNNNCFFKCCESKLPFKITKNACNEVRRRYNIPDNEYIPISVALKIAEEYKFNLLIHDADTTQQHSYENKEDIKDTENKEDNKVTTIGLLLKDNHYSLMISKIPKLNKCKECGRVYFNKHSCNRKRVEFYQKVKLKVRGIIKSSREDKENLIDNVMHYDIETYVDENNEHNPSVVMSYFRNERKIFTNMESFVEYTVDKMLKLKETIYINAYNGANFDHYKYMEAFMEVYPEKKFNFLVSNGSLISFTYAIREELPKKKPTSKPKYKIYGIKLIDLAKHLTGSLKNNLIDNKCKTLKGEFDYSRLTGPLNKMSKDVQKDCLLYLKSDVEGLRELYNIQHNLIYDTYKLNLCKFLSTSSLALRIWQKTLDDEKIELPTVQQDKDFRQAIYGGRCYLSKKRFISNQYQDYVDGKVNFDDIDDYIVDCDVVSLYPTAMQKFNYPIGEALETNIFQQGKLGIYKIRFNPNRNLCHPIIPRREIIGSQRKLRWDLNKGEGWYTSISIEDMIKHNYEVEVITGYYWENSAPIFKNYIDQMYQMKATNQKGTSKYLLAKLYLNSLYGKMIQRPIHKKQKIITSNGEFWWFAANHTITDFEELDNGKHIIAGIPIDELDLADDISKPSHIGAFILDYSRRIMRTHFNNSNSDNEINEDFYYTDTDSIQMHQSVVPKLGKELGDLDNDLGDGAKIVKGYWIAPKLYCLSYIIKNNIMDKSSTRDDVIKKLIQLIENEVKKGKSFHSSNFLFNKIPENWAEYFNSLDQQKFEQVLQNIKLGIFFHFRGKGLNSKDLTIDSFERMNEGGELASTRDFAIKRLFGKKNSKQQHHKNFALIHQTKDNANLTRVVNKHEFKGRLFINGNDSVPVGHCLDNEKEYRRHEIAQPLVIN